MDSEDEREIAKEIQYFAAHGTYYWRRFGTRGLSMRRHHSSEMRYRAEAYYQYRREEHSAEEVSESDLDPEASASEVTQQKKSLERIECHIGDVLRVRRFFETFIGFHEGDLDLTGRWQRRYTSLLARMLAFLDDIDKLRAHIVKTEKTVTFGPDFTHTFVDYTISSPSLEAEFMAKYQLAGMNVEEILEKSERIKTLLEDGSQPKFQTLTLLQLPNELLSLILRNAGIAEARLLAATCTLLRALALPFVFQTRTLCLPFVPHCLRPDTRYEGAEERFASYKTTLDANIIGMRDRFVKQATFLLSRPDIVSRICELKIVNEWNDDQLRDTGIDVGSTSAFRPVRRHISAILRATTNLNELHLYSIPLTKSILNAMTSMTALHTVYLSDCWLRFDLSPIATVPQSFSVANLMITRLQDGERGDLMVTRLFPSVKTLILLADYRHSWDLFDTDFPAIHNPFRTVERLHIQDISLEDVPCLSNCLRDAAVSGYLRLTHFKIAQRPHYVLQQQDLLDLVSALRGAPLEVITMSGLAYVGEGLFAALAEAVPDISALTLAYRQNAGQDCRKPSRWPETSYQYASYLAALPRLRTFAWNFDLEPLPSCFPSDLPILEGCPVDPAAYCDDPEDDTFAESSMWLQEWECLAKLFSAHVPSLQSLVFLRGGMPIVYDICSDTGGKVCIKTHYGIDYSMDPLPFLILGHPWLYTEDHCRSQAADAGRGSESQDA